MDGKRVLSAFELVIVSIMQNYYYIYTYFI